jgi:hypothetical protein
MNPKFKATNSSRKKNRALRESALSERHISVRIRVNLVVPFVTVSYFYSYAIGDGVCKYYKIK